MGEKAWRRTGACGLVAAAIVGAATITTTGTAGAASPLATASLVTTTGEVIGTATFLGRGRTTETLELRITAASAPGLGAFHGLHIHTTGVCDPNPSGQTNVPFGSAGGHWNPTAANHGSHVGDLPSLLMTGTGRAFATFETDRFQIGELFDADGSAVVLHAGPDNFANIPPVYGPPNATTLATGDAGGRYACGVVTPV